MIKLKPDFTFWPFIRAKPISKSLGFPVNSSRFFTEKALRAMAFAWYMYFEVLSSGLRSSPWSKLAMSFVFWSLILIPKAELTGFSLIGFNNISLKTRMVINCPFRFYVKS